MQSGMQRNMKTISYLEWHQNRYAPKFRTIDLLLKTTEEYVSLEDAAQALEISEEELRLIMKKENITNITQNGFLTVMAKASSEICRMYQRERECGSPFVYTQADVAYIYNLDLGAVNHACDRLSIKKMTAYTLPLVLAEITVADM